MIETLSAVVAIVAAIVATVQAVIARAATHGELARETLHDFWDKDSVDLRQHVLNLQQKQLGDWTELDMAAADQVARQLSLMGFMVKHRYIAKGPFMEFWGGRAIRIFRIVEPHLMTRREEWSAPEQWVYAEWLARSAFLYAQKRRRFTDTRSWKRLQVRSAGLCQIRGNPDGHS